MRMIGAVLIYVCMLPLYLVYSVFSSLQGRWY